MKTLSIAVVAAATLGTTAGASTVDPLSLLSGFNGIVLGDMTSTIHVEGTLFVGGDLNGSGGFYANSDDMAEVSVHGVTGSLVVGGDINAPLTTAGKGSIQIGGSLNVANPNPNPNGQPISDGLGTDVSGGIAVTAVADAMTGLATDLSQLATTAGASIETTDPNIKGLTSGAGEDGVAILNLTEVEAQTFFGNGNLANLSLDSGVTTIINVAGDAFNISGTFNQDNNTVLVNFFEATLLDIGNTFGFSILAPFADVTLSRGGMDGTLVAGTLDQRVELRPFDNFGSSEVVFSGTLPTSTGGTVSGSSPEVVPLPAAGWLLLAGLGGLTVVRRKST